MASMTIYDGNARESKKFDGAAADLREHHQGPAGIGNNWNDKIDAIEVHSGEWRLFDHVNFKGESHVYGPGVHRDSFLPKVSSFQIHSN